MFWEGWFLHMNKNIFVEKQMAENLFMESSHGPPKILLKYKPNEDAFIK